MTTEAQETNHSGATAPQAIVLSWQAATTSTEAIERALYALADTVSGTIVITGSDLVLTAHPRSHQADLAALTHLLRQEVTDQSLRCRIAERTDPIRNLVFALAFSRSGLPVQDASDDEGRARP